MMKTGTFKPGPLVLSPRRRVYLRVPQLHAANPERARKSVLRLKRRKGLQQRIPVMLDHPLHPEKDCEAGVEQEERLQQIELVPRPALQDPLLGIIPGEERIVQVHGDALAQPWEDLVV